MRERVKAEVVHNVSTDEITARLEPLVWFGRIYHMNQILQTKEIAYGFGFNSNAHTTNFLRNIKIRFSQPWTNVKVIASGIQVSISLHTLQQEDRPFTTPLPQQSVGFRTNI